MTIQTTTHLNFRGEARAALEFYRSVFGGHAVISTYGDFGAPADVPGADRVVFGLVTAENGFRVMAYDIPGESGGTLIGGRTTRRENGTTLTDQSTFVSIGGESFDEIRGYWDALADGATEIESFAPSAWSPGFGMLTDRFGVTWIFSVTPA